MENLIENLKLFSDVVKKNRFLLIFIYQVDVVLKPMGMWCKFYILVVGNGDLNLHSGLDVDGGDLTHDFWWRMQIDDSLVNSHLEKEIVL